MARQTWAVYSVKDHLTDYAFVPDVLLYDCVRVPVPEADDYERWIREGWRPERQAELLKVLGGRARPLVWDAELREHWRSNYLAAQRSANQTGADAFQATRDTLVESLPRDVTGVDTVCAYPRLSDLEADAGLTPAADGAYGMQLVAASVVWDFAVPPQLSGQPADLDEELEVLPAAVELSDGKAYRRNRRAFWRWARELQSGTVTGQEAVAEAVEELEDLVDEQHELVREVWIDRGVRIGLLVGSVTLGLLAAPLAPVALGGAALAIGQFTWSELRDRRRAADARPPVAAMFCQIDDQIRQRLLHAMKE